METQEYARMRAIEDSHWWFVAKRHFLRDALRACGIDHAAARDKLAVDVGCGTGAVLAALAEYGFTAQGVDMSSEAQKFSQERGLSVSVGFAHALPIPDASVDVVTALDVLEHIEDAHAAVREIYRVLKPGGALIATVPAHQWLWSTHDEALHHKRRYSKASFTALLSSQFACPRVRWIHTAILFPAMILRALKRLQRVSGSAVGSDVKKSHPWVDAVMGSWYLLEHFFFQRAIHAPCGLSLLGIAGKDDVSHSDPYQFDRTPLNTHMLLTERVPDGSTVLEIGSASGYMGAYLAEKKHCRVYGIEPDSTRAAQAQARGYAQMFVGMGEDALAQGVFEGKDFDVLLFADVLEHMVHPDRALLSFLPLLKPNGIVVVSVPNVAHYTVRKMLLFGAWRLADAGIMDRTHLRWFTRESARQMLETSGLTVTEIRPAAGYVERRWGGFGKHLLFAWPEFFAPQFIFVCKKKTAL
jgi:2-polyprenyl-3-methyl-5-hydroxy-6-metoxy-1,4-benzoquinol methylase